MSDLIAVVFLRQSPPYIKGDIAGFSKEEAKEFVEIGVAKYYRAKTKASPRNKMASSPRVK